MAEKKDTEGAGTIIKKLEKALNEDGDFPVRARVVAELRKLVADPNTPIERIVEVILGEPSLGTRLLHLVNSVVYRRQHPVMTVSQAVVQLGMRALTDLCTGLVLLQRFSPTAQRGGIFADNVKKSILTSLLTSALAREAGFEEQERGYLAGTFFSIGPLLLAYYFPQVFETAEKRAERRKQTITQSITETLGIAPAALSLGIVDALSIPDYYRELLIASYAIYIDDEVNAQTHMRNKMAASLAVAGKLADAIIDTQTRPQLKAAIEEIIATCPCFSMEQIDSVLDQTPASFKQNCKMIDMTFLTLPEHFVSYIKTDSAEFEDQQKLIENDDFSFYLDEIKEALANQETMSSIITSVMEALAFGLKFDRVMLLFSDPKETSLEGRMALGQSFGVTPNEFKRPLTEVDGPLGPDGAAFLQGTIEVYGDPLFANGWPFAAIPIGISEETIGVVYCDKLSAADGGQALTDGTQVGLTLLAELLDQALTQNNETLGE